MLYARGKVRTILPFGYLLQRELNSSPTINWSKSGCADSTITLMHTLRRLLAAPYSTSAPLTGPRIAQRTFGSEIGLQRAQCTGSLGERAGISGNHAPR